MPSTSGPIPSVRLRLPAGTAIVSVATMSIIPAFVMFVVVRGLVHGPRDAPMLAGSALVLSVFVGVPMTIVIAVVRSSVESRGSELVVTSGFITRNIPATEIVDFVIVDRAGRRTDSYAPFRPAIALRPGSPSDRRDRWSDRSRPLRVVRRMSMALTNRRPGDLPVPGVQPRLFRSWEASVATNNVLQAWHDGALAAGPP